MKKRTAFLVIPFNIYFHPQKEILRNILEIAGYKVVIASEKYPEKSQYVLDKIIDDITQAEIAVIELVSDNFNIAFEAGIINRMPHLKTKHCILAAQYLYDQNLIPTDIAGINLTFYNDLKTYISNFINWLLNKVYLDGKQVALIKTYASKYKFPPIYEDFKDLNKLRDNWHLYDSSLNFSPEGMSLTNAHLPIHPKNFGLFNKYHLIIKAKIIQSNLGVAIHIQKDVRELTYPVPKYCLMLNIDSIGNIVPHIFIRDLLNINTHYWLINDKKTKIKLQNNKFGFFDINFVVDESKICIRSGKQKVDLNIESIDPKALNYSLRFPEEIRNNLDKPTEEKEYFENTFKDAIKKLKFGNYGLRCHPNEMALINNISVEF
jgi:hypothetical protein